MLFFRRICVVVSVLAFASLRAAVENVQVFAPAEPMVSAPERPLRAQICLNGRWQFQPMPVPAGYERDRGAPPELAAPKADRWEKTPIKIPSPWNVNAWGAGRDVGAGTAHPFWPDSVYFPSYPKSWDGVEMGWLRRTFRVPKDWAGRRIVLHFEAVAGDCRVLVNGRLAGRHFDKYLPFDLDVTNLVKPDADNELLVGVRAHRLFNRRSERFPKMVAPYPNGSETEKLAGIWQDVTLLALPAVRVDDVFVRPQVAQRTLEVRVTVRNDGPTAQTVNVGGVVSPWVNLAGKTVEEAPVPKWRLDAPVLNLPTESVTVPAGATAVATLKIPIVNQLKTWTPDAPNLYGAIVALRRDGKDVDRHYTRFGWRQFEIRGRDLFLNGKKIQLFGDLLHPFGAYTMSRRFVWAWYRMIKDFGGNAVRPHAQIHPREYLDLADEMGLVVLDESAIFGSSVATNFDDPEAWPRFERHLDGLVLRDRNHPSVVGWSFGNELFAIFNLNNVPEEQAAPWYAKLAGLGRRIARLDGTRAWISCDGDEDLRGTLPVWSKHFGHGTPVDRLPDIDKPLMVGESGGTYYARPGQLAEFNGDRAFESYAGRNEALGIDLYDNVARMARPQISYFSASETAWFGLEHLPFGYRDFSCQPNLTDGVFFTRPYGEGEPGMQIERVPPYVATLNPAWDLSLPLYRPLAMFDALKAALAKGGPAPSPWDHRIGIQRPVVKASAPTITEVAFVGDRNGALFRRLKELGVPLSDRSAASLIVVDGATASAAAAATAQSHVAHHGGRALVMVGEGGPAGKLLPAGITLTDRTATALSPHENDPWTASFSRSDLYFAEEGDRRTIMKHGLQGPFPPNARVLLEASNTDWSLFNHAPEFAKGAAVVLYEHLQKPAGAALVAIPSGKGAVALCTLDASAISRPADAAWRKLFANMGVKLAPPIGRGVPAFNDEGALVDALSVGRFAAASVEKALGKDFVNEAAVTPVAGDAVGGLKWRAVNAPSRDRFVLDQMEQSGPADEPFAAYFSFWIFSPRSLDDLLMGGPDAPRFHLLCYVEKSARLFLNGKMMEASRSEAVDDRTLAHFENLPLRKGWNRFLIKVAAKKLGPPDPATLAVRWASSPPEFLRQLDSTIERKASVQ